MEYIYLGHSGLEVSRMGLGTVTFGITLDEKTCQRILGSYYDAGGNLLDTANVYPGGGDAQRDPSLRGVSERTLGKLLKGKRDKFIIATKGFYLMEEKLWPNRVGLSRSYLTTEINNSLKRLQTEYIDLYQLHLYDFYTPLEETMRVLDDCVRAGKIRYAGASNFDGWHIVKANSFAKQSGLTPLVSNQIWYNLVDRVAENSIIPACHDEKVAIISWGALATGFLSGRYKRGDERPASGSRLSRTRDISPFLWEDLATEKNWHILDTLGKVAREHATTIPNVAMRWLLQSRNCDVVLLGAGKIEHFKNNMETVNLKLSDQEMKELTSASEPEPVYPANFYKHLGVKGAQFYGIA